MADHQVQVHEVQLLSVSNAKIDGEPVVIVTIRPDLPSSCAGRTTRSVPGPNAARTGCGPAGC